MPSLKAIIFDVDGTLANTEETHRQAFNTAFREFDLPYHWSKAEYTKLLSVSGGRERIYKFLQKNGYDYKNDLEHLHNFSLAIHQRKSMIYRQKLESGHIPLRSGVKRLLDEAEDKKIKLAIATSTSLSNVETLLALNLGKDALQRFDAIVTSDIVVDKKPSPAVYQFALAEIGMDAENCIAIEDTINGNFAAQSAGLKTVITTHAYTVDSEFNGACLVVNNLGEPDAPFDVTSGDNFGSNYVDIELLTNCLFAPDENIWHPPLAISAG